MEAYSNTPTHRLMVIAALFVEMDRPMPVDLVLTLNARGVWFEEEDLIS